MDQTPEVTVSEFVALINQTFEFAYPNIDVVGELANLRVSKNKWVYFDLKDDNSTVKFFGTVYNLPGPLEDGMMLRVRGAPRLHNLYGFSVNVIKIQPSGEGSIKKAAELLKLQLVKEGLFDPARKRALIYPPTKIGLITSAQSAAYADFVKILSERWKGLSIELIDVQVQGVVAPDQIAAAIEQFNSEAKVNDVLVIIRGGGSAEDLAAFNTEIVTRAVAASRIPTLVAIGHEIDISLAELAADRRASTPSNAAEILVPSKTEVLQYLVSASKRLSLHGDSALQEARYQIESMAGDFTSIAMNSIEVAKHKNQTAKKLLQALSPESVLARGYAIVSSNGKAITSVSQLQADDIVNVRLSKGSFTSTVKSIRKGNDG